MYLAIDTSTEEAGLSLSSVDGAVVYEKNWISKRNHTAELHPEIEFSLVSNDLSPDDLQGIIVAIGPGTFTGVRIGMAAAKGLSLGLNIPIVGIGTLDIAAYPFSNMEQNIIAIIPAGRGEFACAIYEKKASYSDPAIKLNKIKDDHLASFNEIQSYIELSEDPVLICGEIPQETETELQISFGKKVIIPDSQERLRKARHLSYLGNNRILLGDFDNAQTLLPVYIRPSAAEENFDRKS